MCPLIHSFSPNHDAIDFPNSDIVRGKPASEDWRILSSLGICHS
jgi:hypothetical protein